MVSVTILILKKVDRPLLLLLLGPATPEEPKKQENDEESTDTANNPALRTLCHISCLHDSMKGGDKPTIAPVLL